MRRKDLIPRSGIEHIVRPGRYGATSTPAGVTLALKTNVTLAVVTARRGGLDALTQRVRKAFSFELPTLPRRVRSDTIACAWAGPGQWLFAENGVDQSAFDATIREKLSDLAAVSNQSDGRITIYVSGPRLRTTLAKGAPIDLHPRSFKPGDVAMTAIGHIAVHLTMIDETPACELVVFRSYAASLWEWLLEAGAEFGIEVTS